MNRSATACEADIARLEACYKLRPLMANPVSCNVQRFGHLNFRLIGRRIDFTSQITKDVGTLASFLSEQNVGQSFAPSPFRSSATPSSFTTRPASFGPEP